MGLIIQDGLVHASIWKLRGDPDRSDRGLESLQERARELSPPDRPPPMLAREGMVIELE